MATKGDAAAVGRQTLEQAAEQATAGTDAQKVAAHNGEEAFHPQMLMSDFDQEAAASGKLLLRRRTDRFSAIRTAELLASSGWHTLLKQFAQATGLAVTLFDADGHLRSGPFTPTPLAEQLLTSGGWAEEPQGLCLLAGADAARSAVRENSIVHRTALDALALIAVPARLEGHAIGAIVAGWVFDTFPDPVAVDQIAKSLGLVYPLLWQIVRQQSPVNKEKLTTYADLLQTLTDSFMYGRAETLQQQQQTHDLLALNESGHRLTAATDVEEIGAAVVVAATMLTHATGARLLVTTPSDSSSSSWHIAGVHGFVNSDPAADPVSPRERRTVTSTVRIPVEAADGSSLGVIETVSTEGSAEPNGEAQLTALAAQAAVALQKARLIADLKRERTSLVRANRIKDDFLSVLSHELRTPLTPILGWISLLRQNLLRDATDEKVLTALAAIERNARQELHLVDEMLDLSRILNDKVRLEPELVDPHEALQSAVTFAQMLAAPRQQQVAMRADKNLPLVYADSKRLNQILSNLISNAVKFTPEEGSITLGARRGGETHVEFTVTDTGIGIRSEVMPHIFDRFRQADSSTTRRYGGLGIGLSVVHGLVELHGGGISVESAGEGHGSTFIVSLPVANMAALQSQDGAATTAATTAAAHAGHTQQEKPTKRAVLVDDSADTLVVIKAMLEAGGYSVETADSVEAALAITHGVAPDVIISDIGMPKADGFNLLQRLRADPRYAATPVIALTGYASPLDRDAVLQAGFAMHLVKPIAPSALVAAVDEVLLRHPKTGSASTAT